jgi:hypothetical protein
MWEFRNAQNAAGFEEFIEAKAKMLLKGYRREEAKAGIGDYLQKSLLSDLSPLDLDSIDLAYDTNPAMGIRITEDNGETFLAPLLKREAAWWHNVRTPGTPNAYPSDFYYDTTWPNGSIYFYPEPSSAAIKAQLWYRVPFAQVALNTDLSVPPAYRDAMTETLKERLTGLPMFASMASGDIKDAARMARSKAFGNNAPVQRMTTADLGMGGVGGAEYDHQLGPFSLMRGF